MTTALTIAPTKVPAKLKQLLKNFLPQVLTGVVVVRAVGGNYYRFDQCSCHRSCQSARWGGRGASPEEPKQKLSISYEAVAVSMGFPNADRRIRSLASRIKKVRLPKS